MVDKAPVIDKRKIEKAITISPTRAASWETCQARAVLEVYTTSKAAENGTAFHLVPAAILTDGMDTDHPIPLTGEIGGWVKRWMRQFKYLIDDPTRVLYVDNESHPFALEIPGRDGSFLHAPLNKTGKNWIRGAMDCIELEGKIVNWDWKTGYSKANPAQLLAGAVMIRILWPELKDYPVIGKFWYARTGEVEEFYFSDDEIAAFQKKLVKYSNAIKKGKENPETLTRTLNQYCAFCSLKTDCPTAQKLEIETPFKAVKRPTSGSDLLEINALIEKVKAAKKLASELEDTLKSHQRDFILGHGGEFDAGEYTFTRKEVPARWGYDKELATRLAKDYLENYWLDAFNFDGKAFENSLRGHKHEKRGLAELREIRAATSTREIISKTKNNIIEEIKDE